MEEKAKVPQSVDEDKLKVVYGGNGGHPFTTTCLQCGNHYHKRENNGKCPQCGKENE